MKPSFVLLPILIALSSAPTPSVAEDAPASEPARGPRVGLFMGPWMSTFTQEGSGHRTSLASDVSFGFQPVFGYTFGTFYVEYAPQAYVADVGRLCFGGCDDAAPEPNDPDDMGYFSFLSANVGMHLPVVPLSVYIGTGLAHFGFSSGTENDFMGGLLRVGAEFKFVRWTRGALALRFEAQRLYLSDDEEEGLPDGITTRASTYFLGLGFLLGN